MRKTTVQLEPMSYAMTEEMKTLRTNILFCGNDKKVITVTSCVMGEGKTKISIQLATSLVELKKRVLLIDADLRKSVMTSRLKATGVDKGLTHFLSGQCSLADVVLATNIPGFHVSTSVCTSPEPVALATDFTL